MSEKSRYGYSYLSSIMIDKYGIVNGERKFSTLTFDDRKSWLEERCRGIGASDAAAVLGKSPWRTELDLYNEKIGKAVHKEKSNSDIVRGMVCEEYIRILYEKEMGLEVFDGTGILLRSIERPFMSCTLDAFFLKNGEPCIMEIKSIRQRNDEWSDCSIPNHYMIQILHQFAVTGWKHAILRVRFSCHEGWEYASERTYEFEREDYRTAIESLVRKEEHFWKHNIMERNEPSVRMPEI